MDEEIKDLNQFINTHGMFNSPNQQACPGPHVPLGLEEPPLAEREAIANPHVGPGLEKTQAKQRAIEEIMDWLESSELSMGEKAFTDINIGSELEQPLEQQALQPDPNPPSQFEVSPSTQEGDSSELNSQRQLAGMADQQQLAPEVPAGQPELVLKTVTPSTEPLLQLPFKVTVLEPQDKPKNYVYTNTFNMLLTKPNKPFTIDYSHDQYPENQPMYVRATLEYADPTQVGNRVEICKSHSDKLRMSPGAAHGASRDEVWARSVLKSHNPGPGVYQCGDPDDALSCFSVVVKATGSHTQHTFYMECMNSCSSGMANRKTLIVFTLEDQWGNVYARQVMKLRSCSSPFRDLRDMLEPCQVRVQRARNGSQRTKNVRNGSQRTKHARNGSQQTERANNGSQRTKRVRLLTGSAGPTSAETDTTDFVADNTSAEQRFALPSTDEISTMIVLTSEDEMAYARFFVEDVLSHNSGRDPRVPYILQRVLALLDELRNIPL